MVEYQDGQAFVSRAQDVFSHLISNFIIVCDVLHTDRPIHQMEVIPR
jgi:hypothetical protein